MVRLLQGLVFWDATTRNTGAKLCTRLINKNAPLTSPVLESIL